MRGLYLRFVASGALALVIAWLTVGLFTVQFRRRFDVRIPGAGGGPVERVAAELDALPNREWPVRLAELQRDAAMPLSIVSADALPPAAAAQVSRPRSMFVDNEGTFPSIYVPIRGGAYYLAAAAPAPPSPLPLVAGVTMFVCVLTLTIAGTVGIPLVRRLQVLRRAIAELGSGNWSVQLMPPQRGVVGELAKSITRTAAQLQRQFEEREALLQLASHEIGTPLARMRFQLAILEEGLIDERGRERVRAMNADLDELDTLSTDLVAWMETDRESGTRRDDVLLAPLLRSLAELEQASSSGRVTIDVRVGQDASIRADQRQFQRAVENLLRNACRYAQALVVVDVTVRDEAVSVEVRDDGPGIPPEQRTRVLEPFVSVDVGATRAHRGLGLGLSIVRRIVDSHGGSITIAGATEGGTCVRTLWPRGATPDAGEAEPERSRTRVELKPT